MEDETPKKSKVGKVIAMIFCLISAMVIWLLVMEIDPSVDQTRSFSDIAVETVGDADFTITGDLKINVVLKGKNSELADIKREDIRAILDFSIPEINTNNLGKEQEYEVEIELPSYAGESVSPEMSTVKLILNKKK